MKSLNNRIPIIIILVLILGLVSISIIINLIGGLFIDNNTGTTSFLYLEKIDANEVADRPYIFVSELELSKCKALMEGVNLLLESSNKSVEIEMDRDENICIKNLLFSEKNPPSSIFYAKDNFFVFSLGPVS